MEIERPETRGVGVRVGPPYGGPPPDFEPGPPVEYPTSGIEHEFFRDDAMPPAINRQAFQHEAAWAAELQVGGE